MPHSLDPAYAERAIPQYERAVELAGGEPVRLGFDQSPADVKKTIEACDGVLLPGSKADVDPARFGATHSAHTAAADPRRDEFDELLLEDAYRLRKPVLGICYGLQGLNVYRQGSLIQHITDFLPEELRAKVNHEAGKTVAVAHNVAIDADSNLAEILCRDRRPRLSSRAQLGVKQKSRAASFPEETGCLTPDAESLMLPVNSSHHQSADVIGKGLRVVARCPDDNIIEALEGTAPDHFVLAVQWHPERSVEDDAASLAIFRALIDAASQRHKDLATVAGKM
jgi:putative glutamine amidotransferase